ncbi:MAG: nucleotidyltransferase domain-containing protein [Candidatus Omnitrophica bacterium]|nr:nucleotidyltransferase domain-containing protein [Candidatus Omnitrophota bacterium]
MDNKTIITNILKDYFKDKDEVVFVFLFGSAVKGNIRKEGDIDIAVYFRPENDIEWEAFERRYKEENKIALELERLLKKEIDLIVLNRARAVLANEILRNGKPVLVKDRGMLMDFFCIVSDEAEYVRDWLISHYEENILESNR